MKSERCAILFFTILLTIASILVSASFHDVWWYILLCFSPANMIMITLCCHHMTWRVTFSSDSVSKEVFWKTPCKYKYSQIRDVVTSNSYTDHNYIEIIFIDRKHLRFRADDDNAQKAIKILQSHHSFKQTA